MVLISTHVSLSSQMLLAGVGHHTNALVLAAGTQEPLTDVGRELRAPAESPVRTPPELEAKPQYRLEDTPIARLSGAHLIGCLGILLVLGEYFFDLKGLSSGGGLLAMAVINGSGKDGEAPDAETEESGAEDVKGAVFATEEGDATIAFDLDLGADFDFGLGDAVTEDSSSDPIIEQIQELLSGTGDQSDTVAPVSRLRDLLQWFSFAEKMEFVRNAVSVTSPGHVLSRLKALAVDATDDTQRIPVLQLLNASMALTEVPTHLIFETLHEIGAGCELDGVRSREWSKVKEEIRDLAHSEAPKEAIITRIHERRSQLWKIGFPLGMVDELIDLSTRYGDDEKNYRRIYTLVAAKLAAKRWEQEDLIGRYYMAQYVAGRIAATGDLVRARMVLSDAGYQGFLNDRAHAHDAAYEVLAFLVGEQRAGIDRVTQAIIVMDEDVIRDITAAYQRDVHGILPPVHALIRAIRRRATESFYNGKVTRARKYLKGASILVQTVITDPILQLNAAADDLPAGGLLSQLRTRLLEAIEKGPEYAPEQWALLVNEVGNTLSDLGRVDAAYDMLRALQKLDLCNIMIYHDLIVSIVTKIEIMMHQGFTGEELARLTELRDRFTMWQDKLV